MNTSAAEVRPTYWQCEECPDCKTKSWATPWKPVAMCLKCKRELVCLPVYLPTNPQGSDFGRQ